MRFIVGFGAIFLITAILFSPSIRHFLSNRTFVFLGSISFPLYLLHGTFIRLPLAWAFFGVLPHLPFLNILEFTEDSNGEPIILMTCRSFGCRLTATILFFTWLAGLLAFCRIWKSRVDILGVHFSRWMEDIVMGRKQVEIHGTLSGVVGDGMVRLGEKLSSRGRIVELHEKGCHHHEKGCLSC